MSTSRNLSVRKDIFLTGLLACYLVLKKGLVGPATSCPVQVNIILLEKLYKFPVAAFEGGNVVMQESAWFNRIGF